MVLFYPKLILAPLIMQFFFVLKVVALDSLKNPFLGLQHKKRDRYL